MRDAVLDRVRRPFDERPPYRCEICDASIGGGLQVLAWSNATPTGYVITCMSHYCRARAAHP